MKLHTDHLSLLRRFFHRGVNLIENAGLLVIAIATTVAVYQEIMVMVEARKVTLSDLLLMFLYLEVLAMVGRYFESGHLPVRFPLYIGMVALARYLIIDIKQIDEWRILAIAVAILLLTIAVLAIRYGHLKYPYKEDADTGSRRTYGRE